MDVSSLMDVWLLLRNHESYGERNRTLFVLKARGMAHSNRVREFLLSDAGIDLVDVYRDGDHVLTGSARTSRQARDYNASKTTAKNEPAPATQRRLGITGSNNISAKKRK